MRLPSIVIPTRGIAFPRGPLHTLLLTGLLALFPFIAAPGRMAVTGTVALITAVAWRGADRAAARLGLFITFYLTSILLGSAYSQLSFGAAILLYLLAIWRVPRLQGDQPWLRWGQFSRTVQTVCLAVAAGAGLGLFLWHALAKPDLSDLLNRFLPKVGLPVLILGGVLFSMLNAAVEEIAYRGILLDALRDVGLPIALAIGLQAAAFGSIHIAGFPRGWSGVGLATAYGTALGAIRIRAAGMLAPWIAHVLTDLVIVSIVLALV